MNPRVAVLGTGRMGTAIARRLADTGVELVLWNRTRSRAEEVGVGTVVGTPAEAVAMVDVVITSLTGPDALRATFGGPAGALAGARKQSFVEMSTAGPDVLEELAPLVARTASTLIDAPVIGAPPAVLRGEELVIAGGERAVVERVRPVLDRLGEVRHVGPFGSGARLKLVANSMLAAVVLIAAELETAGKSAGLDPAATFDVLTRLVPALAIRRAGYLEDKHEPTMFALRDLRKDLDLALGAFHRADARVPMTALVREWVGQAASADADLDISAVTRLYVRSAGSARAVK
jgi:3-hydroxyisobutyrate dehydrogenase-like beta-hydroxyacid dehydrogenase